MSRKNSSVERKGIIGEIWEIIKIFLMAIVLAVVMVQFIRPTKVDGISMYSTLDNNDYLIINRISRYTGVKRGQIIVFDTDMPTGVSQGEKSTYRKAVDFVLQDDSDTKDLIKRVIAIGGDRIQIKDGVVRVNGQVIDEPYISQGNVTEGDIDTMVPEGTVFCMGDNRQRSLDSRYPEVGFIKEEKVVGSVLVRLLPTSKIGLVD